MELNKKIEELFGEFGVKLNNDTRSNLKKKLDERASKHGGRKRTSRLEASVKPSIEYSGGAIRFTLKMNDYWEVVNDGRKASSVSKEGQKKISEWSAISGFAEKLRLSNLAARLDKQSKNKTDRKKKTLKKMPFELAKKQAGFLVARSLKNKSLDPTLFFTEVIKDGRIEELKTKLSELIKTEIIIDIRNGINNK